MDKEKKDNKKKGKSIVLEVQSLRHELKISTKKENKNAKHNT